MFGKHKLMRDGAHAKAAVILAKRSGGVAMDGGYSSVGYHLELRVQFDDGSSSEVSCQVGGALTGTDLSFFEGDIVPVRYDPADHSKVAVDVPAMEAVRKKNEDQLNREATDRAEAKLAEEMRATPGAPGNTREYVKAELERARRFNTPIGIRVSQKLQEAWVAGRIQTDGGDELAMRKAFDDLKAEIRLEAAQELSESPPPG
jgi:hypothetical protein